MAPWVHLYILPNLATLPCCVSPHEDSYGKAGEKSLQEAWNSEKFKDMRLKLLNDNPVYSCDYCYTLEESGVESMRKRFNSQYKNHLKELEKTSPTGEVKDLKLRYLDFRFSNFCNFKCRGCSPTLSTSWYEDHEKLWDFKSDQPKIVNEIKYHPNIWNELKGQFSHLETAYFAGGEPLMMEEHYKCLEYFISHNLVNIKLSYNTNLSVLKYKKYDLIDLWKKFKDVELMVSIDDIEQRGEYFRSGLDWKKAIDNFRQLKEKLPHVKVSINCTTSVFNISRIPQIHQFFIQNEIVDENGFFFNPLVTPECYRTQILPEGQKKKIIARAFLYMKSLDNRYPGRDWSQFRGAYSKELEYLKQMSSPDWLDDFKSRTQKLDEIRGEDFRIVFPEIAFMLD